jgi:hypothetical protein
MSSDQGPVALIMSAIVEGSRIFPLFPKRDFCRAIKKSYITLKSSVIDSNPFGKNFDIIDRHLTKDEQDI